MPYEAIGYAKNRVLFKFVKNIIPNRFHKLKSDLATTSCNVLGAQPSGYYLFYHDYAEDNDYIKGGLWSLKLIPD